MVLWGILSLGQGAPGFSVDLESVFQKAWAGSFPSLQVDLAIRRASWVREFTYRQDWPALSVDSVSGDLAPPVSILGSSEAVSVSRALGLTLGQKLPGGGRLTLTGTTSRTDGWVRSLGEVAGDWRPTFTLGVVQPLKENPSRKVAAWTYELEILNQRTAQRDAFLALVRTGSDLDLARRTLGWRKALEAAALEEVDESTALVLQGRGAVMDLWKAQRKAETTRWDRIQAETGLGVASDSWARVSRIELPTLDDESLQPPYPGRVPDQGTPDFDLQIPSARKVLEQLQTRTEQSFLAPSLKVEFSGSRPADSGWTWSGQIGISIGTDFWFLDSTLEQRQAAADQRWDLVIETVSQELRDQRARWDREIRDIREAKGQLAVGLRRLSEIRDAVKALSELGAMTRSEVLASDAEILALGLEARRLDWQEVLLSFQLAPPAWLFR